MKRIQDTVNVSVDMLVPPQGRASRKQDNNKVITDDLRKTKTLRNQKLGLFNFTSAKRRFGDRTRPLIYEDYRVGFLETHVASSA